MTAPDAPSKLVTRVRVLTARGDTVLALLRLMHEQVSAPELLGPPQQLRQATLPVPGLGRSETG